MYRPLRWIGVFLGTHKCALVLFPFSFVLFLSHVCVPWPNDVFVFYLWHISFLHWVFICHLYMNKNQLSTFTLCVFIFQANGKSLLPSSLYRIARVITDTKLQYVTDGWKSNSSFFRRRYNALTIFFLTRNCTQHNANG